MIQSNSYKTLKVTPEVMVWNGFVEDVVSLGELLEDCLYKEKPEVALKHPHELTKKHKEC